MRYTAADPTPWLSHARTLRQAAEDLWIGGNPHDRSPGSELGAAVLVSWSAPGVTLPEMGRTTRDVCFMLFGFALENLAKGIIVGGDPKRVGRKRLEDWHGNGHKLAALLDWAAIPLTDKERELLDRTSRTTEWKGRYAVPMNFYQVQYGDPLIGYIAPSNVWPADDYKELSALYDTAKTMLLKVMKEVPPLPGDYDFGE